MLRKLKGDGFLFSQAFNMKFDSLDICVQTKYHERNKRKVGQEI